MRVCILNYKMSALTPQRCKQFCMQSDRNQNKKKEVRINSKYVVCLVTMQLANYVDVQKDMQTSV